MRLEDWVSDKVKSDEPKPAVRAPRSADEAREQATAPTRAFPALGSQSPLSRAVGAPAPWPLTPSRPTASPTLLPRSVPVAEPRPVSTGWRDWESNISRAGTSFTAPKEEPAASATPAPKIYPARLNQIVAEVNKTNAQVRDTIKTPSDMFDMDAMKELTDFTYDMRPDEWKQLQDTFGGGDATSTPEGTLLRIQGPGLEAEPPKVKADEYTSAPLTWDAYQALSGDQKSAVDFNTLLVEAREKDLSKEWTLTPEEKTEYDSRVSNTFGKEGGSDQLAPNTVKLLASVDFQALGQDLDQYLSLERGFTMDELDDFKLDKDAISNLIQLGDTDEDKPGANFTAVRAPENVAVTEQAVVAKTSELVAAKMAEANYALTQFQSTVADQLFNPTATPEARPLGYGDPATRTTDLEKAMEDWLQTTYTELQMPGSTPAKAFMEMDQYEFTPQERQYFFDYVNQRSLTEEQYGIPAEAASQTRPAAEIRKLFGIGG